MSITNFFEPVDKSKIYKPSIFVYTDGACVNNGKPNAKAGIGIYFGKNDKRNVSRRVKGKQSNNTAELSAIIEVFTILKKNLNEDVAIYTDSQYSMRCATSYGRKMEALKWQKDIPNKLLVKNIYNLFKNNKNVKLFHIKAHSGKQDKHSLGNEEADRLANESIGGKQDGPKVMNKIYLNVPYAQKEIAKKLGAKWDRSKKKWFTEGKNEHKNELIKMF